MTTIPTIDFALFDHDPTTCSKQIKEASEVIGFFYLKNHGIRQELIDEVFENACHTLCMKVLQLFAIALEIPDSEGGKSWFENRHRYETPSGDILRILHYPAMKNDEIGKDEIRAGSHSDYGSLTILFQKDVGGLELLSNTTDPPLWTPAPIIPNHVLINIGDLLEFWSKGLFKSTIHRVVFRTNETSADETSFNDERQKASDLDYQDRYSIAYFCHAEDDVKIDPIPSKIINERDENVSRILDKIGHKENAKLDVHKVITAGEYLKCRLDASYKY
ncbi:13870_t:CDS:2 [Acaulospora colombiana]|uniref:13870_t:CDS:1 n=1 Tax=Acaulospora colombiana TaxID=27376 RepID=A0ACA9KXR8_9GLOM|nr:13870_t:CDS:2 [Acaulospora colombiana]